MAITSLKDELDEESGVKKEKKDKKKDKKESDFLGADFILKQKRQIIPVCPAIDLIAKGIMSGTWNTFVGVEKSGKTTTILHFCAKAQKPEYGGRNVYYMNIEGRLKARDLLSIPELNMDKFFVIASTPAEKDKDGNIITPANILTAEEFLARGERVLKDDPGCVLVIDSESMLVTDNELTSGMDQMQRADGAKLMAKFTRKVCNLIPVNDNIVISVRHITCNVSGYGAATLEKGSKAGAYEVDMKLLVKKVEGWTDKDEKQIGQIITWQLKTGALDGAMPGSTISSYLRYGIGIDEIAEVVQLAIDFGLVEMKGSWLTCHFMKNHAKLLESKRGGKEEEKYMKVQGQDNLVAFIKDNPEWKEALIKDLKALL